MSEVATRALLNPVMYCKVVDALTQHAGYIIKVSDEIPETFNFIFGGQVRSSAGAVKAGFTFAYYKESGEVEVLPGGTALQIGDVITLFGTYGVITEVVDLIPPSYSPSSSPSSTISSSMSSSMSPSGGNSASSSNSSSPSASVSSSTSSSSSASVSSSPSASVSPSPSASAS